LKNLFLLLTISFALLSFSGYAGGGCAAAPNNSCANASPLTVDAACTSGSTCAPNTVNTNCASQSNGVWYSFVANATSLAVMIEAVSGGCYFSSAVYSGGCGSLTELDCQTNSPLDDIYSLTGLTIGNTYYILVTYPPGGPCGDNATFCISVVTPTPPCPTCAAPCGTAEGYATTPSVATVTTDCTTQPFIPPLAASTTHTFCYSFQATSTSVDFNVIITSNCGGGNVTAFSWSLYNATCGAPIMTGTLASLTFSPVVVGNNYVFCYTFTVPSTCSHSQHCPYFVGATVLPVDLVYFDAGYNGSNVKLNWTTATETNNAYFGVERSKDALSFETVNIIKGAGNSSENIDYSASDATPYPGDTYYRLKQTDFNGQYRYSPIKMVHTDEVAQAFSINPNPTTNSCEVLYNCTGSESLSLRIIDYSGRVLSNKTLACSEGRNVSNVDLSGQPMGMYVVVLTSGKEVYRSILVKSE